MSSAEHSIEPLPSTTFTAVMLKNASHFNAGDVSQVNAENYHNRTHGVKVSDGGHYSSNVEVKAGVYNHHEIRTVSADPLKDLYGHITVGAMHNSDDRADAPKCHEDTRKAVQENIFSWMSRGDEEGQLLWLTGPAGSGKTAIMGTVSDRLEEMGHLAASFYFASYTGSAERKSKRRFVTTLAYQLQGHPRLKERIFVPMMVTIQHNPAVFRMNLKEQMEKLVLRPLRESSHNHASDPPMIIVIDGVDECGEDRDEDLYRAKEQDQIEVLSVILQAMHDATFPCRFIVASRPESWIRRFFTDSAAGHVTEVFLDDSYNPDKDIKLFLDSKFAELGRRYGYRPSTWPKEEDVAKLVENASGQFIYAATVVRFIDTPPRLPQDQLQIVLNTEPSSTSSPFRLLDALYTSILKSSASAYETALWLQSIRRLRSLAPSPVGDYIMQPCAWTINRLFESSPGHSKMVLELPSLVYLSPIDAYYDAFHYIEESFRPAEAGSSYAFYHKSFLDFLEDPARFGAEFPDICQRKVERWIWERISRAVECDGPEVPLDSGLLPAFTMCVQVIWGLEIQRSLGRMAIEDRVLSSSNPMRWLQPWTRRTGGTEINGLPSLKKFRGNIFVSVHQACLPLLPCRPGCKRWRGAIDTMSDDEWRPTKWRSTALLLDKWCFKRLPWVPQVSWIVNHDRFTD